MGCVECDGEVSLAPLLKVRFTAIAYNLKRSLNILPAYHRERSNNPATTAHTKTRDRLLGFGTFVPHVVTH